MKPPPDMGLKHYLDSFDPDMAYQLREIDPATLEEMWNDAVIVKENLMIKKFELKHEKPENKVKIKEERSSSTNLKLDALIRTMKRMADRMINSDRPQEPEVRNLNFRNQHQPQ